jgi:hypothetical protein
MRTIVYFGPSIDACRVSELIVATHAGPVKRGDLLRAQDHDCVVILDGEFGQSLSVSPKEILALLDAGKTVIGAASMGALRASELDRFGMIGVGWVYERFKHAPIRSDDDVALIYSPIDGRPVTVPMVDVEYWVEWLERRNLLTEREGARLCRAARKIFFADRTKELLRDEVGKAIGKDRLLQLLTYSDNGIPEIKRQDAEAALRYVAQRLTSPFTIEASI